MVSGQTAGHVDQVRCWELPKLFFLSQSELSNETLSLELESCRFIYPVSLSIRLVADLKLHEDDLLAVLHGKMNSWFSKSLLYSLRCVID